MLFALPLGVIGRLCSMIVTLPKHLYTILLTFNVNGLADDSHVMTVIISDRKIKVSSAFVVINALILNFPHPHERFIYNILFYYTEIFLFNILEAFLA